MNRLEEGWTLERALTQQQKPRPTDVLCPNGSSFRSATAMARHYGIHITTYKGRIRKQGWTVAEALELEGRGLEVRLIAGEELNRELTVNRKDWYTGRSGLKRFPVTVIATGERLFLTADEVFKYRRGAQ
jgi:hypothetical protein